MGSPGVLSLEQKRPEGGPKNENPTDQCFWRWVPLLLGLVLGS